MNPENIKDQRDKINRLTSPLNQDESSVINLSGLIKLFAAGAIIGGILGAVLGSVFHGDITGDSKASIISALISGLCTIIGAIIQSKK